jgi:hypothetical protein
MPKTQRELNQGTQEALDNLKAKGSFARRFEAPGDAKDRAGDESGGTDEDRKGLANNADENET